MEAGSTSDTLVILSIRPVSAMIESKLHQPATTTNHPTLRNVVD